MEANIRVESLIGSSQGICCERKKETGWSFVSNHLPVLDWDRAKRSSLASLRCSCSIPGTIWVGRLDYLNGGKVECVLEFLGDDGRELHGVGNIPTTQRAR